ncbi:MAG TPA: translocation/assembly module TamB domain-containing protein [Terracidiphilus sp.]|nr:translocation/assembly module TamB domain-containing protein [Terracidiphilus sp.]
MTEPHTNLPEPISPVSDEPEANEPELTQPPRPSRLRRFFLRHVPLALAGLVALVILVSAGLLIWISSAQFENMIRNRLIVELEKSTGGTVQIASFQWSPLHLEAEASGLVIHGTEASGEAPYASVDRLRADFSLFGFWSPTVHLRSLDIVHPAFHLIVYQDGSTNQPHPRIPSSSNQYNLNTLFDLHAGHIALSQGVIDYDNRADSFDFQNRWQPLDFQASDVSLVLRYIPATFSNPETYRIEAGAADINLDRDARKSDSESGRGRFQAILDLTRSTVNLRSFRLFSSAAGAGTHTLEASGSLHNFTRPQWQAKVLGDLDMKLLDPVLGFPFTKEGIAHLDLSAAGEGGKFRIDGPVHIDGGSYIGTGVVATGIRIDARVHADPERLLISSVVIRLRQGGQMEGSVDLSPWLPPTSNHAVLTASTPPPAANRDIALVHPPPPDIPVNGKVIAQFKDVPLDAILEMVSEPPFQHLGIGALVNGPATAIWSNGDTNTVSVVSTLNLTPSPQLLPGQAPASGIVDATYTQRNGAVDLRKLELNLPASHIEAHGSLGAYPLTSPSALTVDFRSHNLGEFDAILSGLGLKENGKTGAAALPVALSGEATFHGAWTGSVVDPHLAGSLTATQINVEMPPLAQSTQPQQVHLDSIQATGSYSASRIEISHALLLRGPMKLAFAGALDASPAVASQAGSPSFDANSRIHLQLDAGNVAIADIQPFLTQKLPFAGTLGAQIQAEGPLHSLDGSGWVQLDNGNLYGEPVKRLRAQGAVAGSVVNLSSISIASEAGAVAATGTYSLKSRHFQIDAHAANLDIAKIDALRQQGWSATGKLGFSVSGSGTFDDPQLNGTATLDNLALRGDPVGSLQLVAHTVNRSLAYDIASRVGTAQLTVHGQTVLHGDYATKASAQFSHFNIDSLLKLAHVRAISGNSSLEGAVTVQGPLANPDQLTGEATIQQFEAAIAGVHLKSEGGVHATLAVGHIRLDPLHVIGEDTDLRAQGTLALTGTRQLDLAASGSVNLKLAETLDSDLTAGGTSTFQLEAHGPLANPSLQGRVDFQNGSLSLEDLPNGLSQLHGTLVFNQNRLEVRSLTAMSGGGPINVGGYLTYQRGLYADLSVTGKGVRIRYPQGISSLADATLRLQGAQNSLFLSGDIMITRFSVSPDLDFAALAAQANAVQTITPADSPSNHVRMDVHILSSPQLNFQNAFAKLAGDVDLHVRGTVANPSLQGRISITEGSAMIAGTRYDLQRGDISFTNPVRIEPSIDLSATARVSDYDITLNVHGTPDKLGVTYRSDPPLPEADVVALLALGRTENQQRIYTQQQEQALSNPTTDALLGGALNATVSSRIQKLFGAGSVKVDPNYLGPFGNSTSRIIVEEQFGRNVTLTYATDVNTTGQQLLQAEIAINRHLSVLVSRDESGVFSMVLKATRRFR